MVTSKFRRPKKGFTPLEKRRRRRRTVAFGNLSLTGFTLLELVITISILSVGLLVVFQALSASAKLTRFSNDLIQAVFLGNDLIQEWEFREERHLLKAADLSVSGEAGSFAWITQHTPLADSDALYTLDLKITWKSFSKIRELDLKTWGRYEKT